MLPNFKEIISIGATFFMALIAWIFFRSESVGQAILFLKKMFSFNLKGGVEYLSIDRYSIELLLLLAIFIFFEWISREHEHPFFGKFKWAKLVFIIFGLIVFGVYSQASDFIYFQF